MGHGHLHCGGQINDGFVFRIRLPHVQNRVADFQCIFGLCLGKALRTVLKGEGPFRLPGHFFQKQGAVHCKLLYGLPVLLKYLLPLLHGGGIVEMHHRMGRSLHRLKGLSDNMFPGLGQHLNGHILGDHIPLNQSPDKIVLRVGGCRKTHLYLLEANLHQELEKLQFILQGHGIHQGLIAVPQVHAAPDGRLLNGILPHPVIRHLRGHVICLAILFTDLCLFHIILSPCLHF